MLLKRHAGGDITIIHTSAVIPPFSVSSFFEVGLDSFIHPDDMISPIIHTSSREICAHLYFQARQKINTSDCIDLNAFYE